jgi:hypothetical protein
LLIGPERLALLPSASESLVELDDRQQFVAADLREAQFGLKLIAIGVQSI